MADVCHPNLAGNAIVKPLCDNRPPYEATEFFENHPDSSAIAESYHSEPFLGEHRLRNVELERRADNRYPDRVQPGETAILESLGGSNFGYYWCP